MNTLCHIEFNVRDLDRSQSFYEGLFGWTFRSFMGGQMRIFGQGDTHIGGLMLSDEVGAGASPSVWFQVASLDETTARAVQLGGKVTGERMEVPGMGWSITVSDPDGNTVGLVEYNAEG